MPRPATLPAYRIYKRTGQAVVTIAGHDHYLGTHGTADSREAYNRLVAEFVASGRPKVFAAPSDAADTRLTVSEIVAPFLAHCTTYYRTPDGKPTGEIYNFREVARVLIELYGSIIAEEFGPKCLKALQAEFVRRGQARTYLNRNISRVRQIFKRAISEQLLPPAMLEGLHAVDGLKRGRSNARESLPVRPVQESQALAILPFLSPPVAAMLQVQLATGARSGEIVLMRTSDIDRTIGVWRYRPAHHKTAHHGIDRVITLGPRAQAVILPFLNLAQPDAYLFSPRRADAERRATLTAARTTPRSSGNRPGTNVVKTPRRAKGERYTSGSYRHAVSAACDSAFPPPGAMARQDGESGRNWHARLTPDQHRQLAAWRKANHFHPHRVRHTVATRIAETIGLEAARAVMGHATVKMTAHYAEISTATAAATMARVG